jgi:hypothetical protein
MTLIFINKFEVFGTQWVGKKMMVKSKKSFGCKQNALARKT